MTLSVSPSQPTAARFSAPVLSWGIGAVTWLILTGALLLPGGLVLNTHGGDALHVLDILERLSRGEAAHRDFLTPIGQGAFAPIAALRAAGLDTGQAFLTAQALLGAAVGAATLCLAGTRLPWPVAAALAALSLILTLAMVHGESRAALSISMHYNRWCWALSFTALMAALFPPRHHKTALLDGTLIGLSMAGIALIKLTYFAAFAPIVVLALILTGQHRALVTALLTGIGCALLLTLWLGFDYWQAYLGDVLFVAQSAIRAQPGADILALLTGPSDLVPTVLGLTAVILLRQFGLKTEGLLLLAVLVAGTYVTWQNYANDPLHLGFAALCLGVWAHRRTEGQRLSLALIAAGFAATIAPSYVNLAASPFRMAALDRAGLVPLVIGSARHQDILVTPDTANNGRQIHIETAGHLSFYGHSPDEPLRFQGSDLPNCTSVPTGNYFASLAADLAARDLAQGQPVFIADIINPLWLFGDHPPLQGGAPWYYGGLRGLENAEFILFPVCPNSPGTRIEIVGEMADMPLVAVARTPLYTLYRR